MEGTGSAAAALIPAFAGCCAPIFRPVTRGYAHNPSDHRREYALATATTETTGAPPKTAGGSSPSASPAVNFEDLHLYLILPVSLSVRPTAAIGRCI